MSLKIMFLDELKGFYRSRVMLALWVGMPLLALLIHTFQPKLQGGMTLTLFATFVVSSISGTLASIMLSVGIIHEKSRGVYSLFLVRPVKKNSILFGKFLAVFSCIVVAGIITILISLLYDHLKGNPINQALLREAGKSLLTGFSTMAISSAAGVLIGTLAPSVLVGVILVLYGGNQLSVLGLLPTMLKLPYPWVFSLGFGVVVTTVLLFLAAFLFNRKQF
jgi:ABC-2 type transport system permease protein